MPGVYERRAEQFDAQRTKNLFEKPMLDRFLSQLTPGGTVADIGCGAGEPIAGYILDEGFDLIGVDASQAMLELARDRFPDIDFRQGDMRELELGCQVDGLISWDAFFHLSQDEQRDALPRFARHVRPGGGMMFTVGPGVGEVTGTVGGELVYHASLSPDEYHEIARKEGFAHSFHWPEDPDCCGRSVLWMTGKA